MKLAAILKNGWFWAGVGVALLIWSRRSPTAAQARHILRLEPGGPEQPISLANKRAM